MILVDLLVTLGAGKTNLPNHVNFSYVLTEFSLLHLLLLHLVIVVLHLYQELLLSRSIYLKLLLIHVVL